jgi:expansin (peptidoglycan-binding protein)
MSVMHLDLGTDAFAALADPRCGVVEGLEWRFVERPGDDAIRVVNKDGVNAWWYAFFVHRHRYALARAEVRDAASSSWSEALRQPWGAFVVTSASGLVPPLDVRLTDVHGQVLVLDDIVTSLQPGASFESAAQFPAGLGGGDPLNVGP